MMKTDRSHLHDGDFEGEQVVVEVWGRRLEVQSLVGTVQGSCTTSKSNVVKDRLWRHGVEVESCWRRDL